MIQDMLSKRVLIVDDESNVAMTLAASMEKLGKEYVIETAHSGAEALVKIQGGAYALLITDYKMPGMNGLDLAQAVRRISPDTQVVLMTAYGSAELCDTVGQMGLDGYLDKPFTVAQVREMVKRITTDQVKDGSSTTPPRVLIVEDNPDLNRLYCKALRRAGYQVHTATTLREARDLLAQYHFDTLLCDIHLGGERGTDLVREQGEALKERGTQIILVTAEAQYRSLSEEMGVEFYLEKPVALGPLIALVNRLTAQRGSRK